MRNVKKSFLSYLVFVVFTLHSCSSVSQNIFSKEYKDDFLPFGDAQRFTPTFEDITLTELLIKEQLERLNLNLANQGEACPIIHRHLNRYHRQYFGYIDSGGQRVIWINMIWKNGGDIEDLSKQAVLVFDGCSYHWNISVNLEKKMVFDLMINGST